MPGVARVQKSDPSSLETVRPSAKSVIPSFSNKYILETRQDLRAGADYYMFYLPFCRITNERIPAGKFNLMSHSRGRVSDELALCLCAALGALAYLLVYRSPVKRISA